MAGPIAATIATLLGAGWKPLAAYAWKHGDTLATKLDQPYPDIMRILAYFRRTVESVLWTRAPARDYSAELTQGRPSFGPARDVHKQALKLADAAHTLAVETIAVDGAAADLQAGS